MQKKSANYFFHTFGWKEDAYEGVCDRLKTDAVFVPTTIEVTIPTSEKYVPGGDDAGVKTTIEKEGCTIKRGGAKGSSSETVSGGTFYTPSVEELRGEVHRMLARDDVKAVLAPYREAATSRVAETVERWATTGSNQSNGEEGSTSSPATRKAPKEKFVHISHVVGDSRAMHSEEQYSRALFQAASQFNYLEFPSPGNIPENGITAYVYDRTQGPACAVACAAGTAYRNYLAPLNKNSEMSLADVIRRGQTQNMQMNGLADVEKLLCAPSSVGEVKPLFFDVKNGYVDSTKPRLQALNDQLKAGGKQLKDECISKLRIAIQEDVQVTDLLPVIGEAPPTPAARFVTQTYNSALSVGYSRCRMGWNDFATVVLCGSYEATMLAGILNTVNVLLEEQKAAAATASVSSPSSRPPHPLFKGLKAPPPILLTKVGGGVFGNSSSWISAAMLRAFVLSSTYKVPLNVLITHFGSVDADYNDFSNKSF